MTRVQLQFHIDPDEAVTLAADWARAHGFELVLEQFFPCATSVLVGSDDVECVAKRLERVHRVAFCEMDAETPRVTSDPHDACLHLTIGRLASEGLRESALGGISDDGSLMKRWRKLVREARAGMHKGATLHDPASGGSRRLPTHRHTPGAHDLAARGITMLAAAGTYEYRFDDLAS